MKLFLGKVLRRVWLVAPLLAALFLSVSTASAHGNATMYFTNTVRVSNQHNSLLEVRGRVQENRPGAHTADISNTASAYSSCTGCSTFAVALQVNYISPNAVGDNFNNYANSVNYKCDRCNTSAVAIQYDVITSDWRRASARVRGLVAKMNWELAAISFNWHETLSQAQASISAIIAQFQNLLPSASPAALAPKGAAPNVANSGDKAWTWVRWAGTSK